jgi:RNA polymerase-binding transcription factor DksA
MDPRAAPGKSRRSRARPETLLDNHHSHAQYAAASAGPRSQWEKLAMTTTKPQTSTLTDEQRNCEVCNAVIPPARVKALPGTWLCIECSQEVGGDFIYTAVQENLGKAGSLKLNYGGVSIKKKRRTLKPKTE